MSRRRRAVNPEALEPYALAAIRAQIGEGALVWRYTVMVPVEQIGPGSHRRRIATRQDLRTLAALFADHLGGYTTAVSIPSLFGSGARDPSRPDETREANKHAYSSVYAAAVRASDEYFLALRRELEDALAEGVILVERQDVTIL